MQKAVPVLNAFPQLGQRAPSEAGAALGVERETGAAGVAGALVETGAAGAAGALSIIGVSTDGSGLGAALTTGSALRSLHSTIAAMLSTIPTNGQAVNCI